MSDRLADLMTLRDDLVVWMRDAPLDRKAALVAQYRATLAEIAALEPKKAEGDGIDEIARRRAARRSSSAKSPARSKRSG